MRAIFFRITLCMGVGVFLAVIGFFTRLRGIFVVELGQQHDLSVFEWAWIVVNYPARLLFDLWAIKLRLPPQNDVLVVLVLPSVAILLEWLIIGVLVGIWNVYRIRRGLLPS